ncbi:hypothetical protein IQ266_07935 [filamentous cyanobacterium LEGE 11480]|uniref:Uncharacterized protein n=1 Tax=Romeriopsis navalis LEGE 11480 TaxID=2777977 RepID=A0A928Z334_9CYAN|nr:hypothetical protein [Romeriopsis navalis]MBE9029657.1 hypothetical protein [Romeriopsis navalis LEGE 11480]
MFQVLGTALGRIQPNLRLGRDRKLKQLLVGYTGRVLSAMWLGQGLWGAPYSQYLGDQRVARIHQALADLPADTLGRSLFDYHRDRNSPWPGEKKGFSEALVSHDRVHFLSGIGTDMECESLLLD